eukprot:GSChrysophyteH1.ASY1.ANO1.2153.1 assembled CDS
MFGFTSTPSVFDKPSDLRLACRDGSFSGQTSGQAPGYAQANVVILPKEYAYDFLLYCTRNQKACPLLHVLEEGEYTFGTWGKKVDIRTDLPKYRIFKNGKCEHEVDSLTPDQSIWRKDFVTFVIGCSFSFEESMIRANIPVRHIEMKKNVPMYITNIQTEKAGVFSGPLVVSMRPMEASDAIRAVEITSRFPKVHGAPVHIGKPEQTGVLDVYRPDFGDAVTIQDDEVCVFWACGVTPQMAIMAAKPKLCITHAPGCMLVLDTKNDQLAN